MIGVNLDLSRRNVSATLVEILFQILIEILKDEGELLFGVDDIVKSAHPPQQQATSFFFFFGSGITKVVTEAKGTERGGGRRHT